MFSKLVARLMQLGLHWSWLYTNFQGIVIWKRSNFSKLNVYKLIETSSLNSAAFVTLIVALSRLPWQRRLGLTLQKTFGWKHRNSVIKPQTCTLTDIQGCTKRLPNSPIRDTTRTLCPSRKTSGC